MKLHLPHSLFRALLSCFALSVAFTGTSFAERVDSITYTTHQEGPLDISEKAVVSFENIQYEGNGAAIYQDGSRSTVMTSNDSVQFIGNKLHCGEDDYWSCEYSGSAIYNEGSLSLDANGDVTFIENMGVPYGGGNVIYNGGTFSLCNNENVTYRNNGYSFDGPTGGGIDNSGTFTVCDNENVTISENFCPDGLINNADTFILRGNGNVTFSMNWSDFDALLDNSGTFIWNLNENVTFSENRCHTVIGNSRGSFYTLSDNGDVTFSGNECSYVTISNGGTFTLSGNEDVTFNDNAHVMENSGSFSLSGNGNVTFSGNRCYGYGSIWNTGTFTLRDNGDVLFEKNVDDYDSYSGGYRLRSIYSALIWGGDKQPTLNLSASENHSITFRDSIYAEGVVNLNQDGAGDIIFTGATTEADLREVKRGVAGTAEEILNSRTSEIATNAKLYGGRLIVEDNAILTGQGITVTEGANATIRLNGGTLDETGYAIAVSAGSGLEFEGENTLAASAVTLAGDNFLNFILEEAQTAVNWNADLDIQGGLSLNLTHEDKPVHDSYALLAMQSGNTVTGWDAANLTINGTTAEHLVWENNTLYYRPLLVQENGDTTLDKDVDTDAAGGTIGGKDDVSINGNGHSLTVKNKVQLVQMALKDGIVKLEGENNGIVSVTLTEGGELVLTAGAGLKTGDIISMVASGKGELVISGDITLDNKGIKGKAGAQATVSHADAQVLGDATISNVRVEDSVIDLAEGSTVTFSHVALAAGSRITDDPATLALNDVTAELQLGVNTAVVSVDEVLQAGSTLVQNGNENVSLTLAQDAIVVQLEATTFDSVTLTGDSLVLQLSGVETEFFNGADYIAVSFTSGTGLATFGTDVEVLLTLDEEHFIHGYYVQGSDHTAMLFATNDKAVVTPEPATTTLSLLSLAALAARRKRK